MTVLLIKKIIDGLQILNHRFMKLIENHAKNFLVSPKKMKCALPNSFSVLHFDSMNGQNLDEYLTVAQLSQRYPAFSQGSIRWLIFTKKLDRVVRRIGRKVVLSLSAWKAFLDEQIQK